MSFAIHCSCGLSHQVTEGAAGTFLVCSCGKKVHVPSLGELRKLGLAEEVNPLLQIKYMLAGGDLPGEAACLNCGTTTQQAWDLVAEYERGDQKRKFFEFVGNLLFTLFVGWYLPLFRERQMGEGRETAIRVPVRICPSCRITLDSLKGTEKQESVFSLLRQVKTYRELLDRYPETLIVFPKEKDRDEQRSESEIKEALPDESFWDKGKRL
jgi:hypothetical protein